MGSDYEMEQLIVERDCSFVLQDSLRTDHVRHTLGEESEDAGPARQGIDFLPP